MVWFLLIKIATATLMVLLLVFISEKLSPKIAGIIGGSPLGLTPVVLIFFAIEHGTSYVPTTIPWSIAGLGAEIALYIGYYTGFSLIRSSHVLTIASSIVGGFLFFILFGLILIQFPLTLVSGTGIFLGALIVGSCILHRIPERKINNARAASLTDILLRIVLVSCIFIVVTNVPMLLGSRWAGVFSAFPMSMFPVVLILHAKYKGEAFPSFMKNLSWSISSLVVYEIAVYYTYSQFGIVIGTTLSFLIAILYLLIAYKIRDYFLPYLSTKTSVTTA